MESIYKETVNSISEQINEYINKRMHEIANTPTDHKYQIGDILYGSTASLKTLLSQLIEDLSLSLNKISELSVLDELEEETELLEDDEYIDDENDYSTDEYTEDED